METLRKLGEVEPKGFEQEEEKDELIFIIELLQTFAEKAGEVMTDEEIPEDIAERVNTLVNNTI